MPRRPRRQTLRVASTRKAITSRRPTWLEQHPRIHHADRNRDRVAEELDAPQRLDLAKVQRVPRQNRTGSRTRAARARYPQNGAVPVAKVQEDEGDQRDQQHRDRDVRRPDRRGAGLRRPRVQCSESRSTRSPRVQIAATENARLLCSCAISPPDRQVDRGKRQAGRGNHRTRRS